MPWRRTPIPEVRMSRARRLPRRRSPRRRVPLAALAVVPCATLAVAAVLVSGGSAGGDHPASDAGRPDVRLVEPAADPGAGSVVVPGGGPTGIATRATRTPDRTGRSTPPAVAATQP